jgi:hypothetical protein
MRNSGEVIKERLAIQTVARTENIYSEVNTEQSVQYIQGRVCQYPINIELHKLYSAPDIVNAVKLVRWDGQYVKHARGKWKVRKKFCRKPRCRDHSRHGRYISIDFRDMFKVESGDLR